MDKKFAVYISEIVSGLDCDEMEKKDLQEELSQHLQLLKQEYMGKGLSEQEAVDTAIRCFGKGNELRKELNHSISPFKKPYLISVKIMFGVYGLVALSALLLLRIVDPLFEFRGFQNLLDSHFLYFNTNFIPLRTISYYFLHTNEFSPSLITYLLLYNIILFVPLGLFVPILFRKKRSLLQVIKTAFICGSIIEILQLILHCGTLDM
ncbi:VanZ family protein [Sporolactobacillus nakayamae]|uniref:VanZ like family protein n=1 Tax=Sporolactobacillus nakayamae TaxID=269670 RepID=A0A1I2N4J0_9BACL|nr:VanZ family protein [Sporolactobacillus nakayamae]SFF96436.1 VanZ like family protein [Sporolactobacillus nakayamae]